MILKQWVFLFVLVITAFDCNAQQVQKSTKWFIVLPLRFTHLQDEHTMLSGVKVGREINEQFYASISVYHSFYLTGFRAEANIQGFDDQPRLFIYCVGGELEYYFFHANRFRLGAQLLVGWGFMSYDTAESNFSSNTVNYFALEPAIHSEFKISNKTFLGIGVGYRPILSDPQISYSSDVSNGLIPVSRDFPNGLNVFLNIKGLL